MLLPAKSYGLDKDRLPVSLSTTNKETGDERELREMEEKKKVTAQHGNTVHSVQCRVLQSSHVI